jgi:hypothetical protein
MFLPKDIIPFTFVLTNHFQVRKGLHILILILLFSLGSTWSLKSQLIHPGDCDNNGIVENIDILYIGYAFGETGSPRPNGTKTDFVGWPAPEENWRGEFLHNGRNFYYADCNGDGIINDSDVGVCDLWYTKIHGDAQFPHEFVQGDGTRPELRVIPSRESIDGGEEITLTFSLGDEFNRVDSVYGLAFRLYYDSTYVVKGIDSVYYPEDSWFVETDSVAGEVITFVRDHPDRGYAEFAITRKNQRARSGGGTIAATSIVIETIIIGPNIIEPSFKFGLDSVYIIDNEFQEIPVGWMEGEIINTAAVVGNKEVNKAIQPTVSPNPSNEEFYFSLPENIQQVERLLFFDLSGYQYTAPYTKERNGQYIIQTSGLPSGMYLVVAEASTELYSTKVLVSH